MREPEAHQLGVCARLGLSYKKHQRWLATDEMPEYPEHAQYQTLVVAALNAARERDIGGMQKRLNDSHPAKAHAQLNLDKFLHENRFRRFYGDEQVKKFEHAGPDGEPLPSTTVQYIIQAPAQEADEDEREPVN